MKTLVAAVSLTFIVTLGSATSPSAQTDRSRGTGEAVKGGTMAPPAKSTKPKGPTRPNRGEVGTRAVPLTITECTALGGTVQVETEGLCNTAMFCGRRDENKKAHRVCITAQ